MPSSAPNGTPASPSGARRCARRCWNAAIGNDASTPCWRCSPPPQPPASSAVIEPLVNIVVDQTHLRTPPRPLSGVDVEPLDPTTVDERRCETAAGVQLDPQDVLAAAMIGHVRRIVLDTAGVVIDLGRRRTVVHRLAPVMRCCWVTGGVFGPDAIFAPGAAKPTTPNPGLATGPPTPPTAGPNAHATTAGNNAATEPCATTKVAGTPTAPTEPKSHTLNAPHDDSDA